VCDAGQLEASKEEKSELLRRLKRVKDAAKESQEKSGAMYVYVQVHPAICDSPIPVWRKIWGILSSP
jgi:hypothetical protein